MKIINSNNIIDSIRTALAKDCNSRCLNDSEDFEAVIEAIQTTIDAWMKNRCEGCR